jgi:hypothetical protein
MRSKRFLLCLLVLAKTCSAQLCMPEGQSQPNSPYAYIRAEIKALHWIRNALSESQKFQPIPANDPERLHKTVNLYTVVRAVSNDYDCAVAVLTNYKNSNNESIHQSVDSLLAAIDTTKKVNANVLEMLESVNKAKKPEDIDQVELAKMLADLKSLQKDAANLAMMGVKMSTFGILRLKENSENAKPIAFTITAKQRATLLADVRELLGNPNKKKGDYTYVDGCAAILMNTLLNPLPTSAE